MSLHDEECKNSWIYFLCSSCSSSFFVFFSPPLSLLSSRSRGIRTGWTTDRVARIVKTPAFRWIDRVLRKLEDRATFAVGDAFSTKGVSFFSRVSQKAEREREREREREKKKT